MKPGNYIIAYCIEAGDTLSSIAYRFTGDAMNFHRIWIENRENLRGGTPEQIYPGELLVITKVT
jgi:nucleoid-associated protein YgaU